MEMFGSVHCLNAFCWFLWFAVVMAVWSCLTLLRCFLFSFCDLLGVPFQWLNSFLDCYLLFHIKIVSLIL